MIGIKVTVNYRALALGGVYGRSSLSRFSFYPLNR